MKSYNISIERVSTLEARIVNINPPSGEQLSIHVNRNIRKADETSFLCILTASIYRECNKDKASEDFWVKYAIRALVKCDNPAASAEDLQDVITKELYPHLRAGIGAITGAASIEPILLPSFIA